VRIMQRCKAYPTCSPMSLQTLPGARWFRPQHRLVHAGAWLLHGCYFPAYMLLGSRHFLLACPIHRQLPASMLYFRACFSHHANQHMRSCCITSRLHDSHMTATKLIPLSGTL